MSKSFEGFKFKKSRPKKKRATSPDHLNKRRKKRGLTKKHDPISAIPPVLSKLTADQLRVKQALNLTHFELCELIRFDNKDLHSKEPNHLKGKRRDYSKPESKLERVKRNCLGTDCDKKFTAKGRFQRLCETCRRLPYYDSTS